MIIYKTYYINDERDEHAFKSIIDNKFKIYNIIKINYFNIYIIL